MKISELIGRSRQKNKKTGYSTYIALPLPDEGSLLSHGIAIRKTPGTTFRIFHPYQVAYIRQELVDVGKRHPVHQFRETIIHDAEFVTPKVPERIAKKLANDMAPGVVIKLQPAA